MAFIPVTPFRCAPWAVMSSGLPKPRITIRKVGGSAAENDVILRRAKLRKKPENNMDVTSTRADLNGV